MDQDGTSESTKLSQRPPEVLLGVDLGLMTGLALFGGDGRLRWYRSHHFGNRDQLRRGVHGLLREIEGLRWLVLEGGGPISDIWEHEAARRGVGLIRLSAEDWRAGFFRPGDHRDRKRAKASAEGFARRVIDWSGVRKPARLGHDAAEAVLIGLWGVIQVGWLSGPPVRP
ncbi:MAG: hypothetical protein U0790_13310 [Isosphaeraceae bacterium]